MKIYVASSWRNVHLDGLIAVLRDAAHEVYDFREMGFSWEEVRTQAGFVNMVLRDPNLEALRPEPKYSAKEWERLTDTKVAFDAFARDTKALAEAAAVVLVLPAGRSAHLEAGYAVGVGARLVVYQPERERPDLMLKMADAVCATPAAVCLALDR